MDGGRDHSTDKPNVIGIYGQEVKDFSSQYGAEEHMSYTAPNLAGESTIYPKYGDFTQACVFRTYGPWWRMAPSAPKPFRKTPNPDHLNTEDFIEVEFSESLYPVAVHVYETYNPGAIVRILGSDHKSGTSVDPETQSKWRTLWKDEVVDTARRVRIFSPPIKMIDTPVNLIRLELNHSLLQYYTEVDCIMLCGARTRPDTRDYRHLQDQANKLLGKVLATSDEGLVAGESQRDGLTGWCGHLPLNKAEENVVAALQSLHISTGDKTQVHGDIQVFNMLPGEIIIMILRYLDFHSLACVAQTCRLLQRHASDTILYTEINLQPLWNLVNDNTLDGLAQRCSNLQRLNMSWCRDGKPNRKTGFLRLLQSCKDTLTCLHLSSSSFVTHHTLQVISSTCSQLKDLDLSGCREVDKKSGILLAQLTELEHLNLYRTNIDDHTAIGVIRWLSKLKHLNLGSCQLIKHAGKVVEELGSCCQELCSLDMWRARNLDNTSFLKFIDNCPLLEELDVGWCDLNSGADCFTRIAQKCPNLKKLYLTANRSVCDVDLLALAKHSHHLQQLDILGTREVSSEVVEKVLTSCKEMVMLDVSFCACITDSDVQTWNDKYPHVNIKKSFQD